MISEFPESVEIQKRIPWGYVRSSDNEKIAVQDVGALTCLQEAFDLLDGGQSYRNTLDFIAGQGYSLSIRALKVLWDKYRPDSEIKQNRVPVKTKPKRKSQKKLTKTKRAIGGEKTRITMALKRLEKLEEDKEKLEETKAEINKALSKRTVVAQVKDDNSKESFLQEIEKDREIIFKPNPGPQEAFLSISEQEGLYGGTAGGGKSYALIADPMRYFENKNSVGLLLRKTNDELRELVWKTKELYPKAFSKAVFHEKASEWRFPSGARLWMSYLDRDDDVHRYQGQAYSWIGFDELTHWASPFPWTYLSSRLRVSKGSGLEDSLSMRACVDQGEVLTKSGWKDIKTIKNGEIIYSLSENGNLILKPVTSFHEYNVNENLIKIRKKNLYMSMTPDHRVLYKKYNSKKNNLIRFNEHTGKSIDIVRTSSDYFSSGWDHDIIDPEFLGLYIAEGSINWNPKKYHYKVIITQNKLQNHDFVMNTMKKTGLSVCYSKNGDFQITNKKLWEYLKQFGKSHEKHFPRDFLNNATKEQLQKALNAYLIGDGHWQSDKSCTAVTCSKKLSDDLCEIAIKIGWKVQVNHKTLDNENHNDRYTIYFSRRNDTTKVDKNPQKRMDVSLEHYNGKVYCLGVKDTENFILRQNGYIWVSGNTTNPGNVGHAWVKKMFIDPAPPGQAFWAKDIETGEVLTDPETGKPLFKRIFIPAKLSDNPYLWEDGQYRKNLLSLPEGKRKQLLDGDWTIADGAAFPEFNIRNHVIEPFPIDPNWRKFRSCDYGYSSHTCVLWFAIDPSDEQLVVYRELYVSKKTGEGLAPLILEAERKEKIDYGILDSSVWHKRGEGPSTAEVMIRMGVRWRPSDRSQGSRSAGYNRLHELLKVDEMDRPGIVFFNNCRQIISDLQVIPNSPDGEDDIDSRFQSDHSYDALRYGIMSRPRSVPWWMQDSANSFSSQPSDPIFGY